MVLTGHFVCLLVIKAGFQKKEKKQTKKTPTGLRARATKIQGLVRAFALNQVL